MAIIRPTYNNFSAGEITPDLAGRMDSQMFQSGADSMMNMLPTRLGGSKRRGGLESILEAYNGRLIPWSINNVVDFYLLLSEGEIRIINVSSGATPSIITSPQLPITELRTGRSAYSLVDSFNVKYAQNNRSIYLAHADYPLFEIKYLNYNPELLEYSFQVGTVSIEGNVAMSKKIEDTVGASDPIVASYLRGALAPLRDVENDGTTPVIYAATGFINGKAVTSVRKIKASVARKALWGHDGGAGASRTGTLVDGSGTIESFFLAGPDGNDSSYYNVGLVKDGAATVSMHKNTTATAFLTALEAAYGSDETYYCLWLKKYSFLGDWAEKDVVGSISFRKATTSITYRITFSDASTLNITDSTSGLTGYLVITDMGISINQTAVPGYEIIERISPWMEPDIDYPCDRTLLFNGGVPVTARKDVSGDEPALLVTIEGQDSTDTPGGALRVTRDSSGFTGQLGVIVTPFYLAGDNPSFVAFHQGRMVLGGSRINPNTIFLSKTNEPTSFQYFEEVEFEKTTAKPESEWADPDVPEWDVKFDTVQQIGASSAMRMKLLTDEDEAIKWAASVSDLVVGTSTSEWVVPADVTAIDPRIVLTSRNGSSDIQGRFVKGSVLFIPGSRRGAKMFQPKMGEVTEFVTEHAGHLFSGDKQIKAFDFRQDPEHQVIMTLDDGTAVIGTISDNIIGWAPIETRSGDFIVSMAAITGDGEDYIHAIVRRVTNSGNKYYFERLVTNNDKTFATRKYLDAHVVVSTGASSITGLLRFIGQSHIVEFSSGKEGSLVINGSGTATTYIPYGDTVPVTIPAGVSAIIGYSYTSQLRTMRLDSPELEGVPKQGGPVHVRLLNSGDFISKKYLYGDEILIETPNDDTGVKIFPYSGAIRFEGLAPSAVDQYATFVSRRSKPMNIQLVSTVYAVGENI